VAKQRTGRFDLSTLDDQTSALLLDAVEAFTTDPMRAATAEALAREFGKPVEATAAALRVLEAFGVMETVHVPGETRPTYRFRVASTFLDVLERVTAAYAERLDAEAAGPDQMRTDRARIAVLEAKNALLTKKVDELSFLCDTSALLASTLDKTAVAHAIVDSVPAATRGSAKSWFLVLRDGNAFVYHGGFGVVPSDVEEFVAVHHGALERSLRTGEVLSAPRAYVAIPIPAATREPGFGFIAVLDAGDDGVGSLEVRRLTQLAELAGRSFTNAYVLAQSIVAGVTDELTGVYNRRYLDRRLADELRRARRLGERMSLILLDLDFFKTVNDVYGHPEGDRMLRALARTIGTAVRDIDVVTRWGGEEFAVVIPGANGAEAIAVAERIRESVDAMRLRTVTGDDLHVTVSCGVAWSAPHIHTPAQCVAAADRCLLEAKRLGRNRTVAMSS
jgi:diguanylate cyclase (GGDEF)-like protein